MEYTAEHVAELSDLLDTEDTDLAAVLADYDETEEALEHGRATIRRLHDELTSLRAENRDLKRRVARPPVRGSIRLGITPEIHPEFRVAVSPGEARLAAAVHAGGEL